MKEERVFEKVALVELLTTHSLISANRKSNEKNALERQSSGFLTERFDKVEMQKS